MNPVRLGLAMAAALAVNAAMLWCLVLLNQSNEQAPTPRPQRVVALHAEPSPPQQAPETPRRDPAPEAPSTLLQTVNLEAPARRTVVPLNVGPVSVSSAPLRVDLAEPVDAATADIGARVDHPPRQTAHAAPVYPPEALRQGVQGQVAVRLRIDEQGRVAEAQVQELRGHPAFRQAVLAAAERWRFEPARHRGRPVSVWGVKTVRFTLND